MFLSKMKICIHSSQSCKISYKELMLIQMKTLIVKYESLIEMRKIPITKLIDWLIMVKPYAENDYVVI